MERVGSLERLTGGKGQSGDRCGGRPAPDQYQGILDGGFRFHIMLPSLWRAGHWGWEGHGRVPILGHTLGKPAFPLLAIIINECVQTGQIFSFVSAVEMAQARGTWMSSNLPLASPGPGLRRLSTIELASGWTAFSTQGKSPSGELGRSPS